MHIRKIRAVFRIGSGFASESIRSVDTKLDWESDSGSRKAKMTHKKKGKSDRFHVVMRWMFSLGFWRLLL
jgi:hypothetical protein